MIEYKDLDPNFRNITDLLFFTNRLDLDLSTYKESFYKSSYNVDYLLDRFFKGSQIFWDNLSEVWNSRFDLILSLENPTITRAIEKHISKKMVALLRNKRDENFSNIEYIQYLELCKAKWRRKESLSYVRNYFLELPDSLKTNQILTLIESFIPYVFKDLQDYSDYLCKRIIYSSKNLDILRELKSRGIDYNVSLLKDKLDLILTIDTSPKSTKAFVSLLNEPKILQHLKYNLSEKTNKKIISLLAELSFKEIEKNNYFIFKILTDIDSEFIIPLLKFYIVNLLSRGSKYIKSNCNRIANLNKQVPVFSSKEIFKYLLSENLLNYIKELCVFFPEYKELIAFV